MRDLKADLDYLSKNPSITKLMELAEEAVNRAMEAEEKQNPKKVIPNKRIPELCKCPICKTELCGDDEDLYYCPTCGQALQLD